MRHSESEPLMVVWGHGLGYVDRLLTRSRPATADYLDVSHAGASERAFQCLATAVPVHTLAQL